MAKYRYQKEGRCLAYLLRHCQDPLYISLDGGWASVDQILQKLQITKERLDFIVAKDVKQRFAYDKSGRRIRASQGHSIPGVSIAFETPHPPQYLYHGTSMTSYGRILKEGLLPMGRQWVHLSPDYETAMKVGSRHGNPIVFRFRAEDFVKDGHLLCRADNGVWLAKEVATTYLEVYYPVGDEEL